MGYTTFDRAVAWMRFRAALSHMRENTDVCDIGCGLDAAFLRRVRRRVRRAIGLDRQFSPGKQDGIPVARADITAGLPLRSGSFHHAVMLAVLEHLPNPAVTLREAFRVLRPGGSLIVSWPHSAIDPLLHALHRIGIISSEMESDEHQPRIPLAELIAVLREIGFERFLHRKFELGLNNLLVAYKPDRASQEGHPRRAH